LVGYGLTMKDPYDNILLQKTVQTGSVIEELRARCRLW